MTLPPDQTPPGGPPRYPAYPGEIPEVPPQTPPPGWMAPPPAGWAPPPPGWTPPPPGWTPPPRHLVPLRPTAIVLTAFSVLIGICQIAEAALAWPAQRAYIDEVDAGGSTLDIFTAYDVVIFPYGIAGVGAFVATGIWLHRAHVQAAVLRPDIRQSRSAGWAWGGWIVPVVNFWFPLQVVRDAWQRTSPADGRALRGWWWAAWLCTFVTEGVAGALNTDDTSLLSAFAPAEAVDAAMTLVALALWLKIVWTVTRRHDSALAGG